MYALLAVGVLFRPLGALFFGWFGDRFGRRYALFCSLSGIALVTCIMGCLPSYATVGIWAPLFLAFARMMQNFCMAGESTGASVFVLEHTGKERRTFMSSIIDSASLSGILLASLFVTLMAHFSSVSEHWRILFWFSSLTALFGLYFRIHTHDALEFVQAQPKKEPLWPTIRSNYKVLIGITFVAGLSHTTYVMAFTFMNGFVPFVTTVTKEEVLQVNTWLLVLDMFLLPFFGLLAQKYTKETLMLVSSSLLAFLSVVLFGMLSNASFEMVLFVRISIVVLGVCFAASYHAWAFDLVAPQNRFTILSLASALGSQLIGAPSSALCLWLYTVSGIPAVAGVYLGVVSLFAAATVYVFSRERVIWKKRCNRFMRMDFSRLLAYLSGFVGLL